MMKRHKVGGKVERGGSCGGDSKETISSRSHKVIKAVCLQYLLLSREKGRVVDFHRGAEWHGWREVWLAERAGDGGREVSVVWRLAQCAGLAVLVLLVWLETLADINRHRGGGCFSGAKQPQGSDKEGTSLVSLQGLI